MPLSKPIRDALNLRLDREVIKAPDRTPPDYTSSQATMQTIVDKMAERGWALTDWAGNPIADLALATQIMLSKSVTANGTRNGTPYTYPLLKRSKTFVGGPVRGNSGEVLATTGTPIEAFAALVLFARAHDLRGNGVSALRGG